MYRHDVKTVKLPGNSTVPVEVLNFNTSTLQSALLRVDGDANIVGYDGSMYLMEKGAQRIYTGAEFDRKGNSVFIRMAAAAAVDVNVSIETVIWDGV